MITPEFLLEAVRYTNLYANQKNRSNWKPVTVNEMKAFFGVILWLGVKHEERSEVPLCVFVWYIIILTHPELHSSNCTETKTKKL